MKKTCLFFGAIIWIAVLMPGCGGSSSHDGVKIENQVWMTENLNVEHFKNGDDIPHAEDFGEWIKAGNEGKPAWSYYDNDPSNGEKYGKLYNWYAVNDPRGLCPEGWRVPSKNDYDLIITSEGGLEYPYDYEDLIYDGEAGWNGYLGGWRNGNSTPPGYGRMGSYGYWWTSTADEVNASIAWYFGMYDTMDGLVYTMQEHKDLGFSVRCIKE